MPEDLHLLLDIPVPRAWSTVRHLLLNIPAPSTWSTLPIAGYSCFMMFLTFLHQMLEVLLILPAIRCRTVVFFLNYFWWTVGPIFVFILLSCHSEGSLQWSTIPDGSPSKDWQSAVGWGDCRIWTRDCRFTVLCRCQWATTAPSAELYLLLDIAGYACTSCLKSYTYCWLCLHQVPEVRGRALPEVLPHPAGCEELHWLHCHQELLWSC